MINAKEKHIKKILKALESIRLKSKSTEGYGFLFNAELNIYSYLQFIDQDDKDKETHYE